MSTLAGPLGGFEDFSLIPGGPLFQLYRRAHLSGEGLQQLHRRLIAFPLIAWLPLLVLSVAAGRAARGTVHVPFLLDVDAHVRLLVALPLLILAELVVHRRMLPTAREFRVRGLIPDPARERFDAAAESALRLRDSRTAELLLLGFVYLVGMTVAWRRHAAIDASTWYATLAGGTLQPTAAGWYYRLVSLPMSQFFLLRWYLRLFIWARFLWQVSRIDLRVIPIHPDRAAGLGFLTEPTLGFGVILFAQGVLFAGVTADAILFTGATLPAYLSQLAALVILSLALVLLPLLVFVPGLARARRDGLREYGALAQRYVHDFDQRWVRGGAPETTEPLLGSADVQSLADMGNSFALVRDMRAVPFNRRVVLQLAVVTILPLAPLALTLVSLRELLGRLLKTIF
jgi:hypothetical protein